MKIFGREPVMWLAAIQSVLAVLMAVPRIQEVITPEFAAWLMTAASALFAVVEMLAVRPVTVAMLSGVARTAFVALAVFGLPLSDSLADAIVSAITIIWGFVLANSVTPKMFPDPAFHRAELSA